MSAPQSDTQLIQLVKRLLDTDPVDVARLRELASRHGLVSSRLRARAWPKLLGADVYDPSTSAAAFEALQRDVGHPDASIVAGDVERCAWLPREGLAGPQLAARRAQLATLIDGAICYCNADPSAPPVHYFQARPPAQTPPQPRAAAGALGARAADAAPCRRGCMTSRRCC